MSRNAWLGTIGSIALAAFLFFIPMQCRVIRAGERGVVMTWGKVEDKVWGEGLHMKRAFAQKVARLDVKIQKMQTDVNAASKDLQEITTEVAMNYHLDPLKVNILVQTIGTDYKSIIIQPAINEVTKATTAKYTAEALITDRENVRSDIRKALLTRLGPYFVIVDDFAIVNFSFSKEFEAAIESKQTAAQNALKASRDLDRIKVEAEQRVVQARAESEASILQAQAAAESLRLQRSVITPELVRLRAIEKWNGVLPTYSGGGAIPFIDIK
jgi:regulator of protease activity HflC (stomatin/prohibitin superfamily)